MPLTSSHQTAPENRTNHVKAYEPDGVKKEGIQKTCVIKEKQLHCEGKDHALAGTMNENGMINYIGDDKCLSLLFTSAPVLP
jgi:hypothetical protein